MATYKVIQDIEAEDKLVGPFSLRQFVYLLIVAVSAFVGYRLFLVAWFLPFLLIPHTFFFALLAFPFFGAQQSSEVWLLAKIRFMVKPRKRVWDQTGAKQMVTITAPKKPERILTKNLSQTEVKSRLEALANTIDSRGWAVKNVNVNLFSQPSLAGAGGGDSSDRLVAPVVTAPDPVAADIQASDDMLDERNNPTAQNLDQMMQASSKAHREKVIQNLKRPDPTSIPIIKDSNMHPFSTMLNPKDEDTSRQQDDPGGAQPDYWFLGDNSGPTVMPQSAPPQTGTTFQDNYQDNVVTPDPSSIPIPEPPPPPPKNLDEEELLKKIHEEKEKKPKNYGHMRVIKPIEEQKAEAARAAKTTREKPPMTPRPDPAILELANNDDLNVATIARQANKAKGKKEPPDEVVISLH
jgi:PrgI family protein